MSIVTGGPLILMGIDAEDGGIGGHGPISVYISVVNSILSNVTNNGSGILVIGGNKNPSDDVTQFWNAIASGVGESITYVNGANIATQLFLGFKMIGIVSDEFNSFFGGLTQAENNFLTGRANDIADFINSGGGLLGFTNDFFNPYAYLTSTGLFVINTNLFYDNITATVEGSIIGINDNLDICCWHDEYLDFPSALQVLAINAASGEAAAIGGKRVILGLITVPFDIKPTSCPNPFNIHADGVLPTAILGTSTFDVTTIDLTTVVLEGPAGQVSPIKSALEDVATPFQPFIGKLNINDCNVFGPDGNVDLVLHFDSQQVASILGPVNNGDALLLQIKGKLNNSTQFVGEDIIKIIKKK
ncbi:hypothetical protein [Bacillus toyonensis]|uniref:hypothetical protein n=1 Tax=Bacillus toyonensis TaxID=155322 RepID=UPI003000C9BF